MGEVKDGNIVGSTLSNHGIIIWFNLLLVPSIATTKQGEYGDIVNTVKATQDQEEANTIDRRNLEEVEDIYSEDNANKETDNLYEEIDDRDGKEESPVQQNMQEVQSNPQFYDEEINQNSEQKPQNTRRQAMNEFRVWYARPKFPKRNPTTERLAIPKKPHVVTNPFLFSDFRGMIHADYKEALDNLDVQDDYNPGVTASKRGFASSNPSQTGMSINLKGKKKYSESVKEMFPMPEFNTYLSDPTKKKERMKRKKPHTAAIGFRTKSLMKSKVRNYWINLIFRKTQLLHC